MHRADVWLLGSPGSHKGAHLSLTLLSCWFLCLSTPPVWIPREAIFVPCAPSYAWRNVHRTPIFKGQIQRGGPFSWLDFPSKPSVTCQQTAGTGTWRGLRDRDTFPRKHTVKWLLGDPDLQRQVGTSWARSDWKRDALIAANTGACRGEGTVNLRNLPLSDSTMEQNLGKPKIHLKVLCGDITNLEVN